MSEGIKGIEEIGGNKEAREAGGSASAGALYGAQGSQGVQAPVETGKPEEAQGVKGVKDKIDISESEESGSANNLQALKGNLTGNQDQGFKQGLQRSFAMNSIQGIQSGMEPGMQEAGVFKSPPVG